MWSMACCSEPITSVDRFCCKLKLKEIHSSLWNGLYRRFPTFGKLSWNKNRTNRISAKLSRNANIAGYQNHMLVDLSDSIENIAPIIGPIMNPTENAMPTRAMALPRFFVSDTSVIMAILSDMFPLLSPPTKRASTKIKKFDENAHITYETEIPTYFICWVNKRNDEKCARQSQFGMNSPNLKAISVFDHNNPKDRPWLDWWRTAKSWTSNQVRLRIAPNCIYPERRPALGNILSASPAGYRVRCYRSIDTVPKWWAAAAE